MTEDDWAFVQRWNTDPDILHYAEGGWIAARSLEETQKLYREASRTALVFVAELIGKPVGECWLQEMNVTRILRRFPDWDCYRIDLMIGEKKMWGQGWGSTMIKLLTRFAFEQCGADAVFGCGIADYNRRSRRVFEKNGYLISRIVPQAPGAKALKCYDLLLTRERYTAVSRNARSVESPP